MIIQGIEYKRWMKELNLPTAKKTRGQLEDPRNKNARCCLGHACAANNLIKTDGWGFVYYKGDETEAWTDTSLPPSLSKKLNINIMGKFTVLGVKQVEKILKKVYTSLADVNDDSNLKPKEIGALIQKLAKIEKQTKKSMFLPCWKK